MNYATIKPCDIANGPGVRVSLFVSGCTHHCPGCFQPETWDFNYGEKYTEQTQEKIIELLSPNYISGLTILGGEPMEPENILDVCELISQAKRFYPDKTIWLYSGYTFEELDSPSISVTGNIIRQNILRKLDILVDGPFVEAKKDLRLKFCGSSNQRLIDLRKTEAAGKIVLWEEIGGDIVLDKFGKLVRDIRITRSLLLYDMAKALDISPAELSAIECGRRPVPDWFVPALEKHYGIGETCANTLRWLAKNRGD